MVSQLLFGEPWELLLDQGDWYYIRSSDDRYEGWIDKNQAISGPSESEKLPRSYTLDLVQSATSKQRHVLLVLGSALPEFDGINFRLGSEKFVFNGQATVPGKPGLSPAQAMKVANKYLGVPYLWGGRSPLGLDCSGLVQVVFKVAGIQLPRDASQQALMGEEVAFVHQAREGDLAFFDNEEERIVHVGVICAEGEILHASGKVRRDRLDQRGIYDTEQKKYSHKLRFIKRLNWHA